MKKRWLKPAKIEVKQTLRLSKRERIIKSNVMDIIENHVIQNKKEPLPVANQRGDDGLDYPNSFTVNTLERVY